MGDVILQFKMRTMEADGFKWCLKSDVDKLTRHHQQQVIEGNKIREGQRAELAAVRARAAEAYEHLKMGRNHEALFSLRSGDSDG